VLRQYELIEKIRAYDPDADEGLINRAYVFSMKAHGAQLRASGDPYFSHPIEVAGILTDLKLDDEDELIVELGRALADDPHLDDGLYGRLAARYGEQQLVELMGFGAIMVATNVFNDALGVPLDDYLQPYRRAA